MYLKLSFLKLNFLCFKLSFSFLLIWSCISFFISFRLILLIICVSEKKSEKSPCIFSIKLKLILTTDHGTINCKNPSKVIGDKNTSLNLRYKTGRSLTYEDKDVYAVKDPKKIGLPALNMSSSFIFAKNDLFLAYVNNFNHYVSYYRNTYQHGGISLEEMIIPFLVLEPK